MHVHEKYRNKYACNKTSLSFSLSLSFKRAQIFAGERYYKEVRVPVLSKISSSNQFILMSLDQYSSHILDLAAFCSPDCVLDKRNVEGRSKLVLYQGMLPTYTFRRSNSASYYFPSFFVEVSPCFWRRNCFKKRILLRKVLFARNINRKSLELPLFLRNQTGSAESQMNPVQERLRLDIY